MDTQFHALPPLKRFRLIQQQHHQEEGRQGSDQSLVVSSQLPSKKRKESRADPVDFTMPSTNYCLPAKKRVWALQPDLLSGKPLFPIDLNIEYQASFNEENESGREKIPVLENPDFRIESSEEDDKENKDPQVKEISESINNTDCVENVGKDCENKEEEVEVEEDDGIVCAVCQSTDGDPSDPIVFCDGCDLMVHATCYGNPLIKGIPEGDWFCTQCSASHSSATESKNGCFSCCLCPLKEGALKPTNNGKWAHIVCALFVPEVFFEDPEGRERIDCSEIPKRRWNQKCYVCKSKRGCAIDCSESKCPLGFHVTCGLKEDLYIDYREGKKKGAIVAGFCKHHTQLWQKQEQTGKFKIVARDEEKK